MKDTQVGKSWYVGIIIIITLGISLACVGSGVKPDDPRLLPPISNIGIRFDDFLKQLSLVPSGGIMAPWITQPPDYLYDAESQLEISGWAAYFADARVVIYDVKPDFLLSKVEQINEELTFTFVKQYSHEWGTDLFLKGEQQYLAARLELADGRKSPFSNIVFISKGKPAELVINTPVEEEIITSESVTLQGTGTPLIHLAVYVNGEKTNKKAQIGPSGNWIIENVPLLIAGFDKESPTANRNFNEITIKAEATRQEAKVTVRLIEPISLLWPFGTSMIEENGIAKDIPNGQVSSFFHDDWHKYGYYWDKKNQVWKRVNDNHPAIDIATGEGKPIYAVANGVVTGIGTKSYGNYLIVDSGGWGTLYLHIVENASNSKVKLEQEVTAGQIIATEGGSGGFAVHLHISVCIWNKNSDRSNPSSFTLNNGVNLNPPKSYQTYFNKMNIELYDWWGGGEFCAQDGCWKNINWENIKMLQDKPTEKYAQGCLKDGIWQGGTSESPYTTRRIHCLSNPDDCKCK